MTTAGPLEIKPERFGRYVLLDRIGIGGMAEVFRAVMAGAQGFQRTFVVKRIISERAQSPYFVEMFVREARINAILHHPNIVQVFDFGEVGGTYFLAMEYVRGRDVSALARRLHERERPCPPGVAAFIAHEVAEALAYAHAQTAPDGTPLNVVHRDVSPSNIICQRTGGVKLLDFGIAQGLGEPEVERSSGGQMFKGKVAYVAPERIMNRAADKRSDLFSLGVVLWELLAGRKLFRAKDDAQTLQNVLEMDIPPPSSIRPDVPPQLDHVVERALARDPAGRYATGYEMAEDLEGVLAGLGYQPRALPALLRELFGGELSSRQIPAASLAAELLAAGAGDPVTGTAPTPSATLLAPQAAPRDYSVPIDGPRHSRWAWWLSGALGSVALIILLVGRGGGRRSLASTVAPPPVPAPVAEPEGSPAVEAAVLPVPLPAPAATPAPANPAPRPVHRTRAKGKGRIARGLSIDPFAEAASRRDR
ncbi:MAG TPA: serine/threonine-protein kinase [Polyangia bacterium]|nr:serine/threonine-protein kinase [Polyangia bacterium]